MSEREGSTRASPAPPPACWSCGASAGGGHFCAACGKIQPLAGGDYFAFFGLPEKLALDGGDLERRYLALSWKLHPDNFVRAGEFERRLSLESAAELNDAYRALREPVARVEHLLARRGVRKEGENKQQAPPELLEEVFELNEALEELRAAREAHDDPEEQAALRRRLEEEARNFEERLAAVDGELETAIREWDAALDAGTDAGAAGRLMAQMNEILNRRSYIRNLVGNVAAELEEKAPA